MAKTKAPVSTDTPHTKAQMTLERNLVSIAHMVAFQAREIAAVRTLAARLNKTSMGDLTKKRERAELARSIRRFNATLGLRLDRFNTAMLWQVVMLVTCVEAYLQDVLVDAATVDGQLMSKSKQVASYKNVVSATSLDELLNALRRRWARKWVSRGGPPRWIVRLGKMGVKDYPVELAPRLRFIWGLRHVIVHSAGDADAAFLKWHPGAAKAVGDRVQVGNRQFRGFLAAAFEFLEPTDRFFLARFPSLLASTPSERVK